MTKILFIAFMAFACTSFASSADEILYITGVKIGRVSTKTGQFELKDSAGKPISVKYIEEDESGKETVRMVKATLEGKGGLEPEDLDKVLEMKKFTYTLVYRPSDVTEQSECIGADFIYKKVTKNEDGSKTTDNVCYNVQPTDMIIE